MAATAVIALSAGVSPAMAQMPAGMAMPGAAKPAADDRQLLLDRIDALERRLADIEARTSAAPAPGQAAAPSRVVGDASSEKTAEIEARVQHLEDNVVMSEPKATVKRIDVWIDSNGNEYDHAVPGAKLSTTYQRETTSRRQTISEEIEEALANADEKRVRIGVNTAFILQSASQTSGKRTPAAGHSYGLANADLTFSAGLAQNTIFFADLVGLSGNPPDNEINPLTLLNSYTARLSRQNEVNVREAWIKTELFNQKVDLTVGRLDLTNYFDRNVGANDETSQFISDSLVNNPALGLTSNGAGAVAVYEPYSALSFRIGAQQSNPQASSLSDSMFALAEVGYVMRPFGLPEGNYRLWGRTDNSSGRQANAFGVSIDQKLNPFVTLFGRYGDGKTTVVNVTNLAVLDNIRFYSAGVQFSQGWVLNPEDTWGLGYSHTELGVRRESLGELYYNLHLTQRLNISPHLQYVHEDDGPDTRSFILPGLRLQASF